MTNTQYLNTIQSHINGVKIISVKTLNDSSSIKFTIECEYACDDDAHTFTINLNRDGAYKAEITKQFMQALARKIKAKIKTIEAKEALQSEKPEVQSIIKSFLKYTRLKDGSTQSFNTFIDTIKKIKNSSLAEQYIFERLAHNLQPKHLPHFKVLFAFTKNHGQNI